jgi:hypothetical protein
MKKNKKQIGPLLFLLAGIGCITAYKAIGSSVAQDGTLTEPFALIPIGYFLITVGIVWRVVIFVKHLSK